MAFRDLSGIRFGRLIVLRYECRKGKYNAIHYLCKCDCGKECVIAAGNLRTGHTKSCGCYAMEVFKEHGVTHGQSRGLGGTPEYKTWCCMISRCKPYHKDHKRYFDRGIMVSKRWEASFENFFEDMGMRPSPELSLDRINNNKGYYKSNCRWGTGEQQARNRRSNHWLEYNGRRMVLEAWSKELGVDHKHITYHIGRGRPFHWIYEYFKNKGK